MIRKVSCHPASRVAQLHQLFFRVRSFDLQWCEAKRLCSSGMDRLRERWEEGECGDRDGEGALW